VASLRSVVRLLADKRLPKELRFKRGAGDSLPNEKELFAPLPSAARPWPKREDFCAAKYRSGGRHVLVVRRRF